MFSENGSILKRSPMCFITTYVQLFVLFVILRDNICQIMPRAFC